MIQKIFDLIERPSKACPAVVDCGGHTFVLLEVTASTGFSASINGIGQRGVNRPLPYHILAVGGTESSKNPAVASGVLTVGDFLLVPTLGCRKVHVSEAAGTGSVALTSYPSEAMATYLLSLFLRGGGGIVIPGVSTLAEQQTQTGHLATVAGAVKADDGGYTVGTDKVVPAGFLVDETSTDSADEGDAGIARMSADRRVMPINLDDLRDVDVTLTYTAAAGHVAGDVLFATQSVAGAIRRAGGASWLVGFDVTDEDKLATPLAWTLMLLPTNLSIGTENSAEALSVTNSRQMKKVSIASADWQAFGSVNKVCKYMADFGPLPLLGGSGETAIYIAGRCEAAQDFSGKSGFWRMRMQFLDAY